MNDVVNHPNHYTAGNIEAIEVVSKMPGLLNMVLKYIWRCGLKDPVKQDLSKALKFLEFEIDNLKKVPAKLNPYKDNTYYPMMLKSLDKKMILDSFQGKQKDLIELLLEAGENSCNYITNTHYINIRLLPIKAVLEDIISKL